MPVPPKKGLLRACVLATLFAFIARTLIDVTPVFMRAFRRTNLLLTMSVDHLSQNAEKTMTPWIMFLTGANIIVSFFPRT